MTVLGALLAAGLGFAPHRVAASNRPVCVDSAKAAELLRLGAPSFTDTTAEAVEFRSAVVLQRVEPADVAVVSDAALCRKIEGRVRAVYASSADVGSLSGPGYTVYALRYGPYYADAVEFAPAPGMGQAGRTPLLVFRGDSMAVVTAIML